MKRTGSIIIAVALFAAAILGAAFVLVNSSEAPAPVPTDASQQAVADEYIIESTNEKSPERVNTVWINEENEGVFSPDSEDFARSLAVIEQSIFSGVYILAPEDENQEAAQERLSYAISCVKELGKSAYAVFEIGAAAEKVSFFAQQTDGIIFIGTDSLSAEEINLALENYADSDTSFTVCLSADFENPQQINADSLLFIVTDEKDAQSLALADASQKQIICCLDITGVDGKEIYADLPLKNLYSLRDADFISVISFDSLKSTRNNLFNCFGAVKTYITTGIAPEIAFRPVSVFNYNGGVESYSGYIADVNIQGSYLFPFFVDGENIGYSANGNITATVDLEPGENLFLFSQNASSTEYKAQSSCEQEPVTFISPSEKIYLLPRESFRIVVVAHCNVQVSIVMGKDEFEAKSDSDSGGFTAFTAELTAPASEVELSSLGRLSVIAYYGDKVTRYDGPEILSASCAEENEQEQVTLPAGNYSPTYENQQTTVYNPSYGQNISYSSSLMCVVKEPYADTKFISEDDNYSPCCSPLAGGTMDYVVAESSGYNSDEGETEYYYDLASGMRIKRDMVELVKVTGLSDNKLNVLSSSNSNGKLVITLDTDWRVPYNFDYPGQSYYHAHNKDYNVTQFTADSVRITFYHTIQATGTVDVSSSDLISSASWSVSDSGNATVLTLKLKNPGEYYGASLSYDENDNMVITVNRKPSAENGYVVILDAGHGGAEPGAVGLDSTVQERYLNLAFAYSVKAELEKKGVTVYMTRTGNDRENDTLSLEERKQITRQLQPDLYISIHCNGSYNPESKGTSTYYYEPFSYNLAKNIYDELLYVHKNYLYPGRQELYAQLSDEVQFYPFSVTRIEDCPSTLIEVGYLTNDEECALISREDNIEIFGKAIADGIYKTLTN